MDGLLQVAEQWNSLGLIPFLLWMHFRSEKRMDEQQEKLDQERREHEERNMILVKGWEKQLNQVIEKYEGRESEIRNRYDAVIANYNSERDTLFQQIDRKLDDVIRFIARA